MSPRRRYSLAKVRVESDGEYSATWRLMRDAVTGVEYRYSVIDENLSARNEWLFTVRIPSNRTMYIEVRPAEHPNLKVWAELQDRSLLFARATRAYYSGGTIASLRLPIRLADEQSGKYHEGAGVNCGGWEFRRGGTG
jgi:hypothetical protein